MPGCLCSSWHLNCLSCCRKGSRNIGHPLTLKILDKQIKDEESDSMRRKSCLNSASHTPTHTTSLRIPPKEHMTKWASAGSLGSAMSCALNKISVFKDLLLQMLSLTASQPHAPTTKQQSVPHLENVPCYLFWRQQLASKVLPSLVIWLVTIFTLPL